MRTECSPRLSVKTVRPQKKKTTNSSQGIEVSVKNVCTGPKIRSVKIAKIEMRAKIEIEIEIVVGVEAQRGRERCRWIGMRNREKDRYRHGHEEGSSDLQSLLSFVVIVPSYSMVTVSYPYP
jgi:hypothetical protein